MKDAEAHLEVGKLLMVALLLCFNACILIPQRHKLLFKWRHFLRLLDRFSQISCLWLLNCVTIATTAPTRLGTFSFALVNNTAIAYFEALVITFVLSDGRIIKIYTNRIVLSLQAVWWQQKKGTKTE